MSGTILILDSVATNRIVLKAAFQHARFHSIGFGALTDLLAYIDTDESIVCILPDGDDLSHSCARIKERAPLASIIALAADGSPDTRLRVLTAGADDVMVRPVQEGFMISAVRSLIKASDTDKDLCPDTHTAQALGFAEEPAFASLTPGRVAVMSPAVEQGEDLARSIRSMTRADVHVCPHGTAMRRAPKNQPPDVSLIDGRDMYAADPQAPVFRLIPDLRARRETRSMMQIALFSEGREHLAAMALDLGADEAIVADASPAEIAHRVGRLLKRKLRSDRMRETMRSGLEAALVDPLTGLHNRRYAISQLRRLSQASGPLAIIMADIDYFKRVNDTHGHQTGDTVLREMAQRLRPHLRADDLIARIGGEEFLIALPGQTRARALETASRLRESVQGTPFGVTQLDNMALTLTISGGVAVTSEPLLSDESAEAFMHEADTALYRAKRAGRNRVDIAHDHAA